MNPSAVLEIRCQSQSAKERIEASFSALKASIPADSPIDVSTTAAGAYIGLPEAPEIFKFMLDRLQDPLVDAALGALVAKIIDWLLERMGNGGMVEVRVGNGETYALPAPERMTTEERRELEISLVNELSKVLGDSERRARE